MHAFLNPLQGRTQLLQLVYTLLQLNIEHLQIGDKSKDKPEPLDPTVRRSSGFVTLFSL